MTAPVPPVKVDVPPVKLGTEFFNNDNGLGQLSTVAPSAPTFFVDTPKKNVPEAWRKLTKIPPSFAASTPDLGVLLRKFPPASRPGQRERTRR